MENINNKQQTEMNKDFVPYELALELKQLRFDESCMSSRDINNGEGLIQVPTFSQAFRFFREKHFLVAILFNDDGDIEYGNLRYNWEIRIITESFKTYDEKVANCFVGKSNYKTYEEAELASLKRLIEIANDKQ